MSIWHEVLRKIVDFRLIEPNYDGTQELFNLYRTGKYSLPGERDMDKVRKNSTDIPSDDEVIKFLKGEEPQLIKAVPRK